MKDLKTFSVAPLSMAVSLAITSMTTSAQQEALEEVTVTGVRYSIQQALDKKENSATIQDSIVAEDIGKFPDQNVAESLQRITGIAIERTNGEGSKITVRGLGPQFNNVNVNGRTLATTDRGREFDFQILPSELISGADVYKASRANIKEGSLGAYVDISTARPLDSPGLKIAGSVGARYSEISEETDPKISAVVSNTFADETVGVLVGFSHLDTSNRIDTASTNRWQGVDASLVGATFENGDPVQGDRTVWRPGRAVYGIDYEERERTSGTLALQWAPSEVATLTFDALYSELSRQADSSGMQVPLQSNTNWSEFVVSDSYTLQSGTVNRVPIDGLPIQRGQDSEMLALGFNADFEFELSRLNVDLSYSKAESQPRFNEMTFHYVNPNYDDSLGIDDPGYIDGQIKGLTDNDFIQLDNSGRIMQIPDTTIAFGDPAAVRSWWTDIKHNEMEDEILEAKFDFSKDVEFGPVKGFDVGVAYLDREKSDQLYKIANGCINTDLFVPLPNPADLPTQEERDRQAYVNRNTIQQFNTCSDTDLPDSLFSLNNEGFLSDESGNFPRNFTIINDIEAFKAALADIRNEPDWTEEILNPGASVINTEETLSLYAQLNFESDLGGYTWAGDFGLRYYETETSSTGHFTELVSYDGPDGSVTPDQGIIVDLVYAAPVATKFTTDYSGVLPSANFKLDFDNGFLARVAAAKVITRPEIEDTGVNRTSPETVRVGLYSTSGNNPFLEPYEATQYDLSLEYYLDNGDAYSVAFFRKDISTFISNEIVFIDTGRSFDDFNGVSQRLIEERDQPSNRSGGEVQGVEIAALHTFDYLPGFLSGFGVQANYTYTQTEDSSAEDDEVSRDNVRGSGDGLEGFSENSYNFVVFYDSDAFQARLAYNWREAYLKQRSDPSLTGLPRHVDDYGQLDFSTSYDFSDSLTATFEVINLTDESRFEYLDITERMALVEHSGRRFELGLRAKF